MHVFSGEARQPLLIQQDCLSWVEIRHENQLRER